MTAYHVVTCQGVNFLQEFKVIQGAQQFALSLRRRASSQAVGIQALRELRAS